MSEESFVKQIYLFQILVIIHRSQIERNFIQFQKLNLLAPNVSNDSLVGKRNLCLCLRYFVIQLGFLFWTEKSNFSLLIVRKVPFSAQKTQQMHLLFAFRVRAIYQQRLKLILILLKSSRKRRKLFIQVSSLITDHTFARYCERAWFLTNFAKFKIRICSQKRNTNPVTQLPIIS